MLRMPLAVRVAAGLAATTVTEVRNLPTTMASLPVTAVSQVLQNYMRVQQQVTALAIRGDEVLAFLHPAEESPEWATFDDPVVDDATPMPVRRSGSGRFALYSTVPEATRTGNSSNGAGTAHAAAPLAGYGTMTLAQLRARLRTLSLTELEALLVHEQAGQTRAPFLTMLSNRITTVRAQ